jgi:transcriptional regulator with XRE-family HTH domain
MDMKIIVGRNVRLLRVQVGMTQEMLAELSGFSQQYISELECGKRNPTVISLFHIATALNRSPVELLL